MINLQATDIPPTSTNLGTVDPRPIANSSPNAVTVCNGMSAMSMERVYPSNMWPIGVAKTPSPTTTMLVSGGPNDAI